MAEPPKPYQLIVEGHDDLHSVVGIMRDHIDWPIAVRDAPVFIEIGKSAEEILRVGYIPAKLKQADIRALGVMLDADTNLRGRYERIRVQCSAMFPRLPREMPAGGVVVDNEEEKRFGVWIMPDNTADGFIEVFLRYLVPDQMEPVWRHAVDSVAVARTLGATCRDVHVPKANLYTWLAWQDPPGQQPGMALTKKILDPRAPSAAGFVRWFRDLYQL